MRCSTSCWGPAVWQRVEEEEEEEERDSCLDTGGPLDMSPSSSSEDSSV